MTWSRVAIVGLGLIGGSLGLALRRAANTAHHPPAPRISGWDQSTAARQLALAIGAIDSAPDNLEHAVRDAELVIVAVPVLAVRDVFAALGPVLQPGAVVTDVASTKALVCGWAADLLPCAFVGGHPMAGSERSGMAHARADLFDGATYCLTPTEDTPQTAVATVTRLVAIAGARPKLMDPATHDRVVAAVSHLPFLLSTLLMELTTTSPEWALLRTLAATGFRDVSRLASGDPRMHTDICLTNATAIRPWLRDAARMLETLAGELDDATALQQRFEHAKEARDDLLAGDTA